MAKTLDLLRNLGQPGVRRVLAGLSLAELHALWGAIAREADIPPADPRERLRWHVRTEQRDRFLAWFSRLPVRASTTS